MLPVPNQGLVGRRRRATTSASTAPFIDGPHSRVPFSARRLPSLESLPIDISTTHSQASFPDLADQRRRSFSPLFRKASTASQSDYAPPPYPNAREDLSSDSTSWFTPRSRRSSRAQSSPPSSMDILPRTKPVIETHTINKEYDPLTGKKMINDYLIIKELGRGVHGKVKLAEDTERGGLVVRIRKWQLLDDPFFFFIPFHDSIVDIISILFRQLKSLIRNLEDAS